MKADILSRAAKAIPIVALLLASQCSVLAQSDYKQPKPDDYNQAATLTAAVLTLAPQPPTSPGVQQNAVAGTLQSVTSRLSVSPATFAQSLASDADLNQAISDVSTNQVSPTRQGHDPAKFRVVRKLVKTLCDASPPLRSDALQTIYNNADQVSTPQQLNENEQLCYLIHAAMVRNGQAAEYDYRRSAIYKRIQRRRFYLHAHPVAQS